MFYDEEKTIKACEENPALIFELIREEHFELVDKLLSKKKVNLNTTDSSGNDVVTRLLKAKSFDLVLKYMKNKRTSSQRQGLLVLRSSMYQESEEALSEISKR